MKPGFEPLEKAGLTSSQAARWLGALRASLTAAARRLIFISLYGEMKK
jgi:hypothetical protein